MLGTSSSSDVGQLSGTRSSTNHDSQVRFLVPPEVMIFPRSSCSWKRHPETKCTAATQPAYPQHSIARSVPSPKLIFKSRKSNRRKTLHVSQIRDHRLFKNGLYLPFALSNVASSSCSILLRAPPQTDADPLPQAYSSGSHIP